MPASGSPPIENVSITRLFCSPTNPRRNDAAVPHVAASLRRFGWQQPIVARRTGEVIAGNTRLKAAQELGMTEVPVWWFDGSDLDAVAFSIADNRTHEFAEWNDAELAKLLEQLKQEDSLDGVGYSEEDLDALVQQLRDQEEIDKDLDDDGADEPPAVAIAKPGDLWVLGEHRLLCGDSTSLKDVLRVMDGDKAALVATDPPYLVDYTGERPNDSGKDWTDSYREIDIKDADGFFRAVFANVLEVLGSHAAIYCWHAHKRCGDIQRIWRELGILDHQQIIWVKPTPVFGRVYFHFRHEPCMLGWRTGSKPEHDGVHEHDSVWEVNWDGKARSVDQDHPTSKPIELFVRPIKKHTSVGDIVFEPFSGSGSQLIAAERTGRRCRAIEISPPFVDVAVRRWQKASGNEATLDGDGRTFAEIAAERGLGGCNVNNRALGHREQAICSVDVCVRTRRYEVVAAADPSSLPVPGSARRPQW
jgi:DNA modification methylase